jgi:histidinol dehydrogenase
MKIIDCSTNPRAAMEFTRRRQSIDPDVEQQVRAIIERVASEGDEALTSLTRQLDCKFIDSIGLRVSEREREAAYRSVSKKFLRALAAAKANISRFHKRQRPASWTLKLKGSKLSQRYSPLRRVGIYVPGGKAAYPSTVLMNALPARIAGVREIVMATPCNSEGKITPEVLVAAGECHVGEIYRIGGAQAIAALTYGTESIRPVDKITGPGNAYVTAAKKLVYGSVGIDMLAGPTEIVIIADQSARPKFVAADMLAQAEHDEQASPICIVFTPGMAQQVELEIRMQLDQLERKHIAQRALDQHGAIILVSGARQAIDIVNEIAPEHLELMVRAPERYLNTITNAGAVFVGPWSTEALGDYVAGPNHTLPTGGTARFSSPLGVADFLKATNIIELSNKRFRKLAPYAEILALAEQLQGHARSVEVRREKPS